jgi:hypothetical protein
MKIERKRLKFINIYKILILFKISLGLDMEHNSISREGRNVKNQNIKGSEHRKYFKDDQNVKSQKDHNIESLIRTSKMTYLWHLAFLT